MSTYIPDFKTAFDRVCIHTGGRAVIDEIEKQLKLTDAMVEPSRATLYRYGNTSSSSIGCGAGLGGLFFFGGGGVRACVCACVCVCV